MTSDLRSRCLLLLYFNPHSHEGSDKIQFTSVTGLTNFNPHSHEGSDNLNIFVSYLLYNFNPHSHEGSDVFVASAGSLPNIISIHTPTKGVTNMPFQFIVNYIISIHTPTKGVTIVKNVCECLSGISIHTPTKGVTTRLVYFVELINNFNPHSHEGSDWVWRYVVCL